MFMERCPKYPLKTPSGWSIQGHSVAGLCTGFILKPLNVGLDGGICTRKKLKALFLTHTHMDHTQHLPQITARHDVFDDNKPRQHLPIYMPPSAERPIRTYMEGVIQLSARETTPLDCSKAETVWDRQCYMPHCVQPGMSFYLNGVIVETLRAYHGHVETIGYGFTSKYKGLKDELKCPHDGQKMCKTCQQTIRDMRKEGKSVHSDKFHHELVYFCDSTIENLTKHEEWKKYPVIMCECTHYTKNRSPTHTHIEDLKPVMLNHPQKQWVLLHASQSYSYEQLVQFEKELQTLGLDIIVIKIN
jgi:ribonuclease BN (tRNA processing enzyme)